MKNSFISAALVAVIAFTMAACTGSTNDPKSVAKHFFEALKTMNIDEAEKYATKESKTMLDLMKTFSTMASQNKDSIQNAMAKQKISYGEPVVNGNEASITITVDDKEKTDFKLKKEEGAWKVAFDKNTLMKTGMEKMEQHGASQQEIDEAQKALDQLNSDSMQEALKGAGKALQEAGEKIDSINK